jgi:hypothetical protein
MAVERRKAAQDIAAIREEAAGDTQTLKHRRTGVRTDAVFGCFSMAFWGAVTLAIVAFAIYMFFAVLFSA